MNYYGNRFKETYIYKRVSHENWQEHEPYPFITGGNLEFATSAELKVTGSFDFEGPELPNTSDLMRVYYSFTDDEGLNLQMPLATLFVGYNNVTHKSQKAKGTLDAFSVLKALKDDKVGTAYTVNRNENIIFRAQEIVRAHGLNVDYTPSVATMESDHTWPAGTTYLEIVNWLCESAGYADALPDAMGTVIIKPLSELQSESPLVFKNDRLSIMYPEIDVENDIDETPNVVRLIYNIEDICISAVAKNLTGSRASLDARGNREITYFEDVGELTPTTSKLNALIDMAADILLEQSADIEIVTLEHGYIPMQLYQPVTVVYTDMEWNGFLDNFTLDLNTSAKVQSKVKRELSANIEIEKYGEILRGEE